ncbi:MAG: permease [Spirochaetales bacterium]|nr:permease [Spirochaetales bacterium]
MKRFIQPGITVVYALFILISLFTGFEPGREIGSNFLTFALSMLKILPASFILIGLFEVWVKKEIIQRHLGEKSSLKAYFWILLLAGTTVGGMYVAFPVSASLYKKGARTSIVIAYLTAAAIFRIPMAIFEASFLGLKFTLIRFAVSLPLIIISSELLGKMIENSSMKTELFPEET